MKKTKLALNLVCGTLLAGCAVAPAIAMTSCSEAPIAIEVYGDTYSYEQSNNEQHVYLVLTGPEYDISPIKSVEWDLRYIIDGVESDSVPPQITEDVENNSYCELTLANFSNELTSNIKVEVTATVTQIDLPVYTAKTSIEFKKTSIVLTKDDVVYGEAFETSNNNVWAPLRGAMEQQPVNGRDVNARIIIGSPIIHDNNSASATYSWEFVGVTDANGNSDNLPDAVTNAISITDSSKTSKQLELVLNKSTYTLENSQPSKKQYVWHFVCTVDFLGSQAKKDIELSARIRLPKDN